MQIDFNGEIYDVTINSAGDAFDTITWTRRSDGTATHLVVGKLRDDIDLDQIRNHLAWKLKYPWKSATNIAYSERMLDVDGEGVEFKVGLSKASMGKWNPDESKIRPPNMALSGRSNARAAVLQDPVQQPRMSAYSDDELRGLWRNFWQEQ
jgi:hypothetical protein